MEKRGQGRQAKGNVPPELRGLEGAPGAPWAKRGRRGGQRGRWDGS